MVKLPGLRPQETPAIVARARRRVHEGVVLQAMRAEAIPPARSIVGLSMMQEMHDDRVDAFDLIEYTVFRERLLSN